MRVKERFIRHDDGENRSVFVGDDLRCLGCGDFIYRVWHGDNWRMINQHYLEHVRVCFALKRIILRPMTTIKTDVIKCPVCKQQQNAPVQEQGNAAVFRQPCTLCGYVITEKNWDVVMHHIEFTPPSVLLPRPKV